MVGHSHIQDVTEIGLPQGPALCILNTTAGCNDAGAQRDRLSDLFARQGRDVRLLLPKKGADIADMTKSAVNQGYKLVLAAGGDGTVNAVAGALVGTETTLGILPLGTLNHFAKDLKIPLALEEAIANAFLGKITRVDVGQVNGKYFLNNSSLGLYPGLVVEREALQRSGHGKWTAFVRALGFALWRYASLTVQLEFNDQRENATTTPFVFVGNNKYQTCAPHIGERASLDEGQLWVCQAPHASRTTLLRLAVRAMVGSRSAGELIELDAKEFRIRSNSKRLRVATDGEVTTLSSPLHYRSLAKALQVIVPRAAASATID